MKTIEEAISDYWVDHAAEMTELEENIGQGKVRVIGSNDTRIAYSVLGDGDQRRVVVWLGISTSQIGLVTHTKTVARMSADLGCKWFEFYTKRKGFIRVAPRLGFERMPDEDDGVMKFRFMV